LIVVFVSFHESATQKSSDVVERQRDSAYHLKRVQYIVTPTLVYDG